MITHSMQQALDLGSRTIILHKGKILEDIPTEEKKRLSIDDLNNRFADIRKQERLTDKMMERFRREYR